GVRRIRLLLPAGGRVRAEARRTMADQDIRGVGRRRAERGHVEALAGKELGFARVMRGLAEAARGRSPGGRLDRIAVDHAGSARLREPFRALVDAIGNL